ncbi:MAG: uroporphyrinogen decarboxylase family protein [Armatimonadota bacterium]|nr:uroporphyrinogen decarboxylase family protein [Armatimonadota bacterium]
MTGLDRFLAALNREEPDVVPVWELIINEPTLSALHGEVGYLEFCAREGLDGVTIFENQMTSPGPDGAQVDEWGIHWKTAGFGVYYPSGGPIKSKEDLESYEPPDPNAPHRFTDLNAAVERFKGEKAIVFLTHEAFEFSHYLRGLDNLMIDYIEDPMFVHELAAMVSEYKVELAEAAIDLGADVIVSGDDYASRHGTIMSVEHWEEYSLPYLEKLVKAVHRKGVPFIKHTDGDIWGILDQMVSAGIDAIDPLEPIAHMDIGRVKERYGDRVCVVGNVDCTEILTHAPIEEVVDAVKETIAKGSPGGGHILASSNSIHPGVKPANYRAMVEAARQFGVYPLDEELVREYSQRSYIERYLDG